MFSPGGAGRAAVLLARLESVVDDLLALADTSCTDEEVVELLRGVEQSTRRLAAVDHALVAQADDRHLWFTHGQRSTSGFLHRVLRVTTGEASARVKAARDLGPRRQLSGVPLEPLFPVAAAAERAGTISAAHARIITGLIHHLPPEVQLEHADAVEAFLVEQSSILPPEQVGVLARRIESLLDPDGLLEDERVRHQRRELNILLRRDGSVRVTAELTAAAGEALLTVLDATSAPRPAADGRRPTADGVKDPRTAAQRRHDGLFDALLLVLRSGALPRTAGVTTTILLTMTAETAQTGDGLVTTGHGATMSTAQAATLAGDARVIPVVFDRVRRVTHYGGTHRLFTEGQRLAMIARDQGCSFPGCDVGPLWTESHHVTDYAITGHTSVDDGTLLCGVHHREHARMGWRCEMTDGVPHWVPPRWIDPDQRPRRNRAHDPTSIGELLPV